MQNLTIDEIVGHQVSSTAEWRRTKAREFPDDSRNLKAAEQLDRLAQEISDLEGSEIHRRIDELSSHNFDFESFNESVSAELRGVGFHGGWTGADFLEWYANEIERIIAETTSKNREAIEAVLREQFEEELPDRIEAELERTREEREEQLAEQLEGQFREDFEDSLGDEIEYQLEDA